MDWEDKFYTIVKETEDNLAKAKEKLCGKASTLNVTYPGLSSTLPPRLGGHHSPRANTTTTTSAHYSYNCQPQHPSSPLPETSALNMSAASGIQVLHMQEQIDSQNRTIEKLQRLVRSLDNERDFYKEQISHLKGEVDGLTDRMTSQFAAASSERHLSSIKREVMREIENVKAMLHDYTRGSNKRTVLSPRFDDDFWAVKENLTESLEQVRHELSLMNKRIDRMESQVSSESYDRQRKDPFSRSYHGTSYQQQRSPTLYTPTYKNPADVSGLDLQQLRLTVNSLNSKLDTLERKIDAPSTYQPSILSPRRTGTSRPLHSYTSTLHRHSTLGVDDEDYDVDDLSSLSGLSDLSNLSDDAEDIDVLSYELRQGTTPRSEKGNRTSSIYKKDRIKKGKVEFDLSDLDLSDVDEIDVDTNSLDLDN